MNLAFQCECEPLRMLVKLPLISKKHLGIFPAVFFYQHPRTVVWTHLHVGIADVDRNLTTVTPLIPVDPAKGTTPPSPGNNI